MVLLREVYTSRPFAPKDGRSKRQRSSICGCRAIYQHDAQQVGALGVCCQRRTALASALALTLPWSLAAQASQPGAPANIRLELAPDQSQYDASDERLREAAQMLQQALNAENVLEEERLWGVLIDKYQDVSAPWQPDIIGRAYGNRGNARSRQGKWDGALADLTKAQDICPWSVDPVLNRGVVFENTGRYAQAEADYKAVLAAAPNDPSAWNNLGNVYMATGRYDEAVAQYTRATQLAPAFSFAAANKTLGLYAAGQTDESMREMRGLLRRYPDFPDMRAALAAAEWGAGLGAKAEADWARVEDPRYRDRSWLRNTRRWPPRLCTALEAFLDIKAVNGN